MSVQFTFPAAAAEHAYRAERLVRLARRRPRGTGREDQARPTC